MLFLFISLQLHRVHQTVAEPSSPLLVDIVNRNTRSEDLSMVLVSTYC